MRVLIDTDVVLDLMLKRPAFFADAFALWQAGDQGRYQRYIAAITPINAFYVARKFMDLASARQAIGELLGNVTVCVIDGNVLSAAHSSAMTDFEDAVQVEAARVAGIDILVTRNTSDYQLAPMTVLTPAEFLARLNQPSATPPPES